MKNMHTHTHTHTHTRTRTHTHTHAHAYARTHARTHARARAHTHTHTHKHTHTVQTDGSEGQCGLTEISGKQNQMKETKQLKPPQNPKRLPTCKHKVEKTKTKNPPI